MKRILLISAALMVFGSVWAQQQIMFTQYMFNQSFLNPAYTGIHDGISISAIAREQWVGFEGAPNTQLLSIHSPIGFSPVSLGGMIIRDQIGSTTQHGAYFSYAYRIKMLNGTKLSLGVQANMTQYRQEYSTDPGADPTLAGINQTVFRPNFGTGIMWHADRFYVGLGVPHIMNQAMDPNNSNSDSELIRHYFLSAGYVFGVNEMFLIKPNFLLKAVDGAPLQVDLNVNMLLRKIIWVGLSYRSLDSFDAVLQIQVGPRLQVGYGFDFLTTTDLNQVNSGSHEIMLNYVIQLPRTKIKTPRYF
ncbi:PorP/SprF family type IX secretion system membrane protein [Marinoscillum pacificum]|uniref:PorP/SprF family type IX secretion system membrane protein n=1 Tax=Marinoscillum pacificum TaxID=392723 RepID=UPI0021583262|nr:type IX secretion system membrane protein PorP/SprF [Marinoscillum pacificum]